MRRPHDRATQLLPSAENPAAERMHRPAPSPARRERLARGVRCAPLILSWLFRRTPRVNRLFEACQRHLCKGPFDLSPPWQGYPPFAATGPRLRFALHATREMVYSPAEVACDGFSRAIVHEHFLSASQTGSALILALSLVSYAVPPLYHHSAS